MKYLHNINNLILCSILILASCQKKTEYEPTASVLTSRVKISSAAWGIFLKTYSERNLLFIQKATPITEINAVNVGIDLIYIKDDLTIIKSKKVFEKKEGGKLFVQNIDSSFYTYQCRNFSAGQLVSGRIIMAFTILRYHYDKIGERKINPILGAEHENLGLYYIFSDNNGDTFSEPMKIETDSILMPNSHFNIINLSSGKSLMSVYGATNLSASKSESAVYSSNNNGLSWFKYSTIRKSDTPPFGETTLLKTEKRILAFVRTENNNVVRYVSENEGFSWSGPIVVSDTMQVPAGLISLKNGNILLVTGNRKPPFSIISRMSIDFGLSFLQPKVIAFTESYNSGYPNGISLNDGTILLTYYDMPSVSGQYKNNWINSQVTVGKFTEADFK